MYFNHRKILSVFAVAMLLMSGAMSAQAEHDDDDDHMPSARNAVWQSECGACHVAYPPRLLPADSWRALMSGLDKHFGSDASLDPAATREISAFLEKKSRQPSARHIRQADPAHHRDPLVPARA